MKKAAIVLLALSLSGIAQAGDPAAGRDKSVSCAACHGGDGLGTDPFRPNLAGQKKHYLIEQLQAFRDGRRDNPIMAAMAKSLSDQDIEDISAYYSSLPAGGR